MTDNQKPCSDFVTIKMSNRQYDLLKHSLEFYSRFLSGQVEDMPPVLRQHIFNSTRNFDVIQQALRIDTRKLIFGVDYVSYGVGWNDDPMQQEIQIAYEMYRACINQDEMESRGYVSRDLLHYSDQELIQIEKKL
jgi:hypothetical protein